MKMDGNLNCLICSTELLSLGHEEDSDYSPHQLQGHTGVLWKLLELDGLKYEQILFDFKELLFCTSCENKMLQIQETQRKLELLQIKLNSWRDEIRSEIIAANSFKTLSLNGKEQFQSKSDAIRSKVVSGLYNTDQCPNSSNANSFNIVKEEIDPLIPCSSPPNFNDECFSPTQFSGPSSPYDPLSTIIPSNVLDRNKENILKREPTTTLKHLTIRLQRIDHKKSVLKAKRAARVRTERTVRKDDGVVPEDPFDANSYELPAVCKITGCKSAKAFSDYWTLRRHIKEVHLRKLSMPPDPLDDCTYPSRCPVEDCLSTNLYGNKFKLRRHILTVHEKYGVSDESIDLSAYKKFPTKCREPSCKSRGFFKSRYTLKMHIKQIHLSPYKVDRRNGPWIDCVYPTKCPVPNCKSLRVFDEQITLRRHIMNVHQNDKFEDPLDKYEYPTLCQILNCTSKTEFQTKLKLRRHIKDKHTNEYYTELFPFKRKISLCGNRIKEPEIPEEIPEVPANVKSIPTSFTFTCECGDIFSSAVGLQNHNRYFHKVPQGTLICESCGSIFVSAYSLKQHCQVHHAEVTPVFPCTLCPKTFKIKRGLQVHMWRHKGVKKYTCSICSAGFMFNIELEEHKRAHHYKELGLEPFQCKICQKIYSKRVTLVIHMKSHTGTDRFSCNLCTYRTSRKKDYEEHMETVHVSDFPHKCEHCSKCFKLKRRLVEHEKYHQDNYPFQCQLCQRRCSSGRTLRIHLAKKHNRDDLVRCSIEFNEREHSEANNISSTTIGSVNFEEENNVQGVTVMAGDTQELSTINPSNNKNLDKNNISSELSEISMFQ